MKVSQKFKCFKQFIKSVWSKLSNAISKSEKNIKPGLFSSSAFSMISKSNLIFSPNVYEIKGIYYVFNRIST